MAGEPTDEQDDGHSPGGEPEESGALPAPGTVVVPDWLVLDWSRAARVAGGAAVLWVAVAVVLVLAALGVTALRAGVGAIDWADLLVSLPGLPLVYLGGITGVPVVLTGLALAYVTLRLAARGARPLSADTPARLATLAVKAAVVFTVAMLVVAIVLDATGLGPDARPRVALFGGGGSGSGYNYVAVVFLLLPITAVAAVVALTRDAGRSLRWLLGLENLAVPAVLSASWAGVRRLLLVLLGVLAVWALGMVLEFATGDFTDFSALAAVLLSVVLLAALAAAVDVTALGAVGAMSLLTDGGFVFRGDAPGWAWLAVLVVAAAFAAGGYRAAQHRRASTVAESVLAASLVGPLVGALGAVVAIVWAGEFAGSAFAARAILLPLLWGLLALGGAWLYAARRELPTGVIVRSRTDSGPPAPPETDTERGGTDDGPPAAPSGGG